MLHLLITNGVPVTVIDALFNTFKSYSGLMAVAVSSPSISETHKWVGGSLSSPYHLSQEAEPILSQFPLSDFGARTQALSILYWFTFLDPDIMCVGVCPCGYVCIFVLVLG